MGGGRWMSSSRWPAARAFERSYRCAGPLRPGRRLRHRLTGTEPGLQRLAAAPLALGGRLLPVSLPGAPGDGGRCARRPVRACRPRGAACRGGRPHIPWRAPPKRISTCASGAPLVSCCSTRPFELAGDPPVSSSPDGHSHVSRPAARAAPHGRSDEPEHVSSSRA